MSYTNNSRISVEVEANLNSLNADVAFFNLPHMKTKESNERYYYSSGQINYVLKHVPPEKIIVEKIDDISGPYWKVVPVIVSQGPNIRTTGKRKTDNLNK